MFSERVCGLLIPYMWLGYLFVTSIFYHPLWFSYLLHATVADMQIGMLYPDNILTKILGSRILKFDFDK